MHFCLVTPWCSSYHYFTTSFNKVWTQVLRRFISCSRIVDADENLWQWSRLEIRLNAFLRSTIAQEEFIIIITIIIIIIIIIKKRVINYIYKKVLEVDTRHPFFFFLQTLQRSVIQCKKITLIKELITLPDVGNSCIVHLHPLSSVLSSNKAYFLIIAEVLDCQYLLTPAQFNRLAF